MENKPNIVTFLSTSKFDPFSHNFSEERAFLFDVVNNCDWNKHANNIKNGEEGEMEIRMVLEIERG